MCAEHSTFRVPRTAKRHLAPTDTRARRLTPSEVATVRRSTKLLVSDVVAILDEHQPSDICMKVLHFFPQENMTTWTDAFVHAHTAASVRDRLAQNWRKIGRKQPQAGDRIG